MPVEAAAYGSWMFLTLGVCAGVVSGMLGVGSGIVIIPALVLLLSIPQKSAQGICLAAMIPMVAIGALRYKLNPDIDVSMLYAALIAAGGVVGAFAGVEIATRLPGSVLRRIFACFIIAVGLRMLIAPGRPSPRLRPAKPSVASAKEGGGHGHGTQREMCKGAEETGDVPNRGL